MWIRMLLRPWWVRWLYHAVWALATGFAAVALIQYQSGTMPNPFRLPLPGIAIIAIGCLGVAGLFAAVTGQYRNKYLEALRATVTPAERSQAITAAWRGPVPDNPRVREAAGRLAWLRYSAYRKNRWMFRVLYPVMTLYWLALCAWQAAHQDRGAVINAILGSLFVYSYVQVWLTQRRIRARIDLLTPNRADVDAPL
ncbi:hypothetical protein [uncultured Mycobacterium sp.]|uniref:hypothetical protein n=1 Tax=uncultured Mycobacterium sp. TaxID=171292 RepID=UPI0035CC930A